MNIPGLALLDARGLLLHAYHRGTDPDAKLSPATDRPVNTAGFGLRGFIDTYLSPLLVDFSPLNIVAVWDGGNDYREGLFAGYKAKRHAAEKDPAVEAQVTEMMNLAKALLAYAGAFNVRVEGVEADDVIGAFVDCFPEVNKLIHTVDRDLLQLQDENCLVLVKNMPADDFEGYPPRYVRIYKSLVGDSTDEYGGVPQVGPAAFKFLVDNYGYDGIEQLEDCVSRNDYGSLLEAVEATGCKVLRKIYESRGTWRTMYLLAGLHPELLYGTNARKIIRPEWYVRLPDAGKVQEVLTKAGDPTLFELFAPHMPTMTLVTPDNWEAVRKHFVAGLAESPVAPFDYETFDSLGHDWTPALPDSAKGYVDVLSQCLTGGSFTYGGNLQHTFYLPVLHRDTPNLPKTHLVELLSDIEDAQLDFVAHSARFEEQVTKQELGFQLDGPVCTQMLGTYVDENLEQGLKPHAKQWLKYDQTTYAELMARHGAKDMRELTGEQVLHYACDDAFVAGRLVMLFFLILKLERQWDFAYQEDRYTLHPFNRGFEIGTRVDYEQMQQLAEADAAVVKANTEGLHAALAEYCTTLNEVGAQELKRAESDNLMRLYLNDGLNRAQAQAKISEAYERWRQASVYRPHRETFTRNEFIATEKGFTRVAAKVGLPVEMTAVSGKGITAWLLNSQDHLRLKGRTDPRAELLVELVQAASGEIRKREGARFEALKQFIETQIEGDEGVREIEGDELNLNSPKQMQELLYCKLQLPVRLRTFPQKKSRRDQLGLEGNPSTNEDALMAALAEDCPEGDWRRSVLQKLIETKECLTRQSLYYAKYPHWKHPVTGVIHPSTRNCGTKTRRPAGGSPNVLAVSKGPLRSIFIPRFKGHVIAALDFSGQELRLTGSESRDPVLIQAYTGGGTYVDEDGMIRARFKDIHAVTGCAFAARVLEQELGGEILKRLSFDETGSLDYEQFVSLLKGGEHVYEMVGDLALPLGKIIVKIRKMAKTVNFLIIYGGQAFSMGMKLGVPERFAQQIIDRVFAGYPRLASWQKEVVEEAKHQGYITTAFGTRKHVDPNILSRDGSLRARAERQTTNHKIQGCLQAGSLVHTSAGLRPIETLLGEVFTVNTGVGWHTATALSMGRAEAVRVTLSSGLTVNCDVRHKFKGADLQWAGVLDCAPGQTVALPSLEHHRFTTADYQVTWPFIIGYWLGDGSLSVRKGSRPTDNHYRSTLSLCGGKTKQGLLVAIREFLLAEGVAACWGTQKATPDRQEKYNVFVNRKVDIALFRELGVNEAKALQKRIPAWVLQASCGIKEEFLRGFLLADGARNAVMRVHTPNLKLLLDLQILAGSINLDTSRKFTKHGGYVEFRGAEKNSRQYPHSALVRALADCGVQSIPSFKGDCESIAERRAYLRGTVTQRLAERMLSKYSDAEEVYRYDEVVSVDRLGHEVETFTLSVDHPLHQYVADGVIHQNCAADILKTVLTQAHHTRLYEETKAYLIAPVYDELVNSVPIDNVFEFVERTQDLMNITPPGHAIPMLAEVSLGRNWYDSGNNELKDRPSQKKIEGLFDTWAKEGWLR